MLSRAKIQQVLAKRVFDFDLTASYHCRITAQMRVYACVEQKTNHSLKSQKTRGQSVTFILGSECSRERKFLELLLPGAKVLRSESSIIQVIP